MTATFAGRSAIAGGRSTPVHGGRRRSRRTATPVHGGGRRRRFTEMMPVHGGRRRRRDRFTEDSDAGSGRRRRRRTQFRRPVHGGRRRFTEDDAGWRTRRRFTDGDAGSRRMTDAGSRRTATRTSDAGSRRTTTPVHGGRRCRRAPVHGGRYKSGDEAERSFCAMPVGCGISPAYCCRNTARQGSNFFFFFLNLDDG